jgi:electron transfer flavoprotein alpha subunit
MQASDTIIAVCDDPDAPIFEIADFGIVGDIFEVVPQALEDLRARKDQ